MTKSGFISLNFPLTVRAGRRRQQTTFAMSPSIPRGAIRFVLTWGTLPRDLDSHLKCPGRCKLYYAKKRCVGGGGIATLDRDVTSGHGPETLTIQRKRAGTYTYEIKQYSSGGSILSSGARVVVFDHSGVKKVFRPTTHGRIRGRLWTVATVNGRTGRVTAVPR